MLFQQQRGRRRMRDMWPLAKARLLVTTLSFLTPLPPSKSIALLFPTHWWWRSSLSSLPPKNKSSSSSSSSLQRFLRFVGSYAVTSPHVYWWSLSYLSNRKHSIIHQTAIPSRFTTATFDCSPTFSQTLSHIFNVIHPMDHFSFLLILLGYFFLFLLQSFLVAVTLLRLYVFFFQSS